MLSVHVLLQGLVLPVYIWVLGDERESFSNCTDKGLLAVDRMLENIRV